MKHNFVQYPSGEVLPCDTPELWGQHVDKCIYKKETLVFFEENHTKKERDFWPSEVRDEMVVKAFGYNNEQVYHYGYYDGFQKGILYKAKPRIQAHVTVNDFLKNGGILTGNHKITNSNGECNFGTCVKIDENNSIHTTESGDFPYGINDVYVKIEVIPLYK